MNWLQNFEPQEIPDALQIARSISYFDGDKMNALIEKSGGYIRKVLGKEIENAVFIQLGESPADSGGNFLYTLRKNLQLGVESFPPLTPPEALAMDRPIVFIDDIIGSGSQATKFSKAYEIERRSHCLYCALFAMERGLEEVSNNAGFSSVYAAKVISEAERAFSNTSAFFPESDVRERLELLARKYGDRLYPKHPLGYGDSQLLLAMHHGVPNNSLPIIWAGIRSESAVDVPWEPLFKREKVISKETHVPKDGVFHKKVPKKQQSDTPTLRDETVLDALRLLLNEQYSDGSWARSLYRSSGRAFTTDVLEFSPGEAVQKKALSVTAWSAMAIGKVGVSSNLNLLRAAKTFTLRHYRDDHGMFGNIYSVAGNAPGVPNDDLFVENPRHTATAIKYVEYCDGLSDLVYDCTFAILARANDGRLYI